jgi:tRNA pseudouridine55 synthase
MREGFLSILKPPGMTSHDVVACLRRKLGTRRVGHAGTLDPPACGVLPVAVGRATRLIPYLASDKEYIAEIVLGRSTSTGDAEGTIRESRMVEISRTQFESILPRFVGSQSQRVPMVSAVHVGGKRLHELARAGIEIADRPVRTISIHELELREFTPGPRPLALIRVACSPGTYIRTLAEDLGGALGVPASLTFLLRTRSSGIGLDASMRLEDEPLWLEWDEVLGHHPVHEATADEWKAVSHGHALTARASLPAGTLVRIQHEGNLIAMAEAHDRVLRMKTVLLTGEEPAI